MEITINYDGRLVTVEVNAKIYEYLDRVNHKMVSEIPMISISVCVAHSLEHKLGSTPQPQTARDSSERDGNMV